MKIFILLFSISISLFSAEYSVVVNKNSKILKLSKKQIKDIYLKKRHFIDDVKVVPINMSSSSQARKQFDSQVLKYNSEKLNRHWVKLHFQGVTPPIIQSSTKSMKLFVQNVDSTIGYLPSESVDSSLRVIYEF